MTDLREAIARELVDLDDLLSLIDDAISESLDMDWQTMWGAKAVVGALEHQGWVVLPASALTAALGREEALRVALEPFAQLSRRKANYVIRPNDPAVLEAVHALES